MSYIRPTLKPAISVTTDKPTRVAADVLVVPLYMKEKFINPAFPAAVRRKIQEHIRQAAFKGEWGTAAFFPLISGARLPQITVVGLGERTATASVAAEGMRRAMGSLLADAHRHQLRSLALLLTDTVHTPDIAAGAAEGVLLSEYRFSEYSEQLRREQRTRVLKKAVFLVRPAAVRATKEAVRVAVSGIRGTTLARDLVNQPASHMSPAHLVAAARELTSGSRAVTLRVLNRAQAARQNFAGFLAVARGSSEEPYVLHLTYTPKVKNPKKIFIIGKGVTFDSGGLSLKPADYMENMKSDMAGAAAVLGLFSVIESLAPAVEVHGVIAACENMPSGAAYRPGDILTAKNGKTIEVLNTDAEGRITLADALSYAAEHTPDAIIDVATLTGACMVALGDTIAGLWSTDDGLQEALLTAAQVSGEGLAALPLPSEYKPFIKSKIADVRNTPTSRYGGAITAALFLQEFVPPTIPWAHLDIAGPSYLEQSPLSYYQAGATGYGVRMLAAYLKNVPSNA